MVYLFDYMTTQLIYLLYKLKLYKLFIIIIIIKRQC